MDFNSDFGAEWLDWKFWLQSIQDIDFEYLNGLNNRVLDYDNIS